MKRIGKRMNVAGFCLALGFACTGCQTAPHGKPLTEMTEAEQIAYNQHAPVEKPSEDRGVVFEDVARVTALIIINLPIFAWEMMAGADLQPLIWEPE